MAEHTAVNRKVLGSSPSRRARGSFRRFSIPEIFSSWLLAPLFSSLMVELADTLDLGSSAREGVRVRLSVRLLLLY